MVKPVESTQPLSGEGQEKYNPDQKRGPGEFDKILEKEKADRARSEISRIADEHRAKVESERPRTYTERLQDMGRLPKPGGGGAGASYSGGATRLGGNGGGGAVRIIWPGTSRSFPSTGTADQ